MEYLPEPNEAEPKSDEKQEKKLKEFRQYIVDKGVVLAFVKVLLSLKYAEKKPKNPIKEIREFFGKYKSPGWEEKGALEEKIIEMQKKNGELLAEIVKMEDDLKNKKRDKRIKDLFGLFEVDKNGLVGSKFLVEKLSGNKKFDADEKFDQNGFFTFVESVVEKNSEEEETLLSKIEEAIGGNTVYKDTPDDPIFIKVCEYFRELKKANKEAAGKK
ncbi:MAG: hypothetical protein MJ252_05750 [archaeon]|nr:hypothetical protein [archaeon]